MSSNCRLASLPTSSVMRSRSRVTICDVLATESLGQPVVLAGRTTLPGASAQTRLLVNGTQTAERMRLRLSVSPWTTTTGLRNPGPEPVGSGGSAQTYGLGKLPFDGFERASRRGCQCWVKRRINHFTNAIHRFGHSFRIVARKVFGYRLRVDLTARLLQATGQPLRLSVNLIGNGDRCFHTESITGSFRARNRRGRNCMG